MIMENQPFEDLSPIKKGLFPLSCYFFGGYIQTEPSFLVSKFVKILGTKFPFHISIFHKFPTHTPWKRISKLYHFFLVENHPHLDFTNLPKNPFQPIQKKGEVSWNKWGKPFKLSILGGVLTFLITGAQKLVLLSHKARTIAKG